MSGHFGFSQVPVNPSFRNAAVNTVAVVPLLSHDKSGEVSDTHSSKSFQDLLQALRRHDTSSATELDDLLLVVPNGTLTRPGEWRYSDTPLKNFHWQHGCQRLLVHDGRPQNCRIAQDRLLNGSYRNMVDICPFRRTAAVIGVLNMHDCHEVEDLNRACEELNQWALRYSTPPYEVTAHGRSSERDTPVQRLFVYDSFDEVNQKFDLSQSALGTSTLAFPPSDDTHSAMMDLHLNVVISDITVAIFRDLERKIRESNDFTASGKEVAPTSGNLARSALHRYISGSSGDNVGYEEEPVRSSRNLGIGHLAGLVSPESKLAKDSPTSATSQASTFDANATSAPSSGSKQDSSVSSSKLPQLLTPLDDEFTVDLSNVTQKDLEALHRRDMSRREKFNADLCLLAGSPLDAYERYLKAAEMCKTGTLDPLWHASALEGCAAAHIAMAEAGGFGVDEYLENNFQLPEDIMAMAREDPGKRQAANANKQTLPEVVVALCDEALSIINRNDRLGPLYAELLLKLASYCAEESEPHLRCRWGEGPFCYRGEQGDQPRWEKTSVYKLKFNPLRTKDGNNMVSINSINRARKVCELLSMAVSVGPLDPATRMDVAARCIRTCLDGVRAMHWKGPDPERLKLPRKAAYFAVVAAETASTTQGEGSDQIASDLWLLASQLYTLNKTPTDGGGDYGWATLRAFCFDCLSMQSSTKLSLEAAGHLLGLLGELEPDGKPDEDESISNFDDSGKADDVKNQEGAASAAAGPENVASEATSSGRASLSLDNTDIQEAVSSASQFAKNLRTSYTNFTAASPLLVQQSKWANDDPIAPVEVPLSDASPLSSSVVSLKLVWPNMDYEVCASAQKRCLDRTGSLQRAVPTASNVEPESSSVAGFAGKSLPLYVSSAMAIQSAAALELECIKKRPAEAKDSQDSMATFFNPYANKKSGKNEALRVSEEEERAMMIKFGNRLSLPLEVQRSQLVFDNNEDGRVKAAALAFVVPSNAKDYEVHFPFTVLTKSAAEENRIGTAKMFDVKGLDLTCCGRSFFVPINALKSAETAHPTSKNRPDPSSIYPHEAPSKKNVEYEESKPQIETYPCQPKLQISFEETGAPAENVSLSLSDGEVYSLPALRLSNYSGPSAQGRLECLQIIWTGSPSLKLFDSESLIPGDTKEADFVDELLYGAEPPPFKIRVINCALSIDSINGARCAGDEGNTLALQFAAAHNLGEQLRECTTAKLQFRYRGPCKSETEVWRKGEIAFNITHTKGPRISSISFRPDLSKHSAFAEMNKRPLARKMVEEGRTSMSGSFVTDRVGMDSEVSVCSDDAVFVLSVVNETRSVVTVKKEFGEPFGGFEGFSHSECLVRPGVSAKIPIVMRRLPRVSADGCAADVVAQLVSRTSLIWEKHKGGESGPVKARGYIRIPPACLNDIILRYPSFLSQVCHPPLSLNMSVEEKPSSNDPIEISMGSPLSLSVKFAIESWVPKDAADNCTVTLEFRASRKNSRDDFVAARREFVWAGKLRRKFDLGGDVEKTHNMRIAFCSPGCYVVSACARISRNDQPKHVDQAEEIWWAPIAQTVKVKEAKMPAQ